MSHRGGSSSGSGKRKGKAPPPPPPRPQIEEFLDFPPDPTRAQMFIDGQPINSPTLFEEFTTQESGHEEGINVGEENEDMQQDEEQEQTISVRYTSSVPTHFNKVQISEREYEQICKYCGVKYKWKLGGGYGTMQRHLKSKHPNELRGKEKTQSQISGYATTKNALFNFSDKEYKMGFAEMVAYEKLSFSFGEKVGVTNFLKKYVNPCAKRIPRNTLKRQIFGLYVEKKKDLINFFTNMNGRVSICSDIWTDNFHNHAYMGITVHLIDPSWKIQKRIIAFRAFDERHTASNIYKLIKIILDEYQLVKKIFTVSFDNAASNTASITQLKEICKPNLGGKFFHIRCACHVLNLCVQDGLKYLDAYILPVKNAIRYLWSHPQKMKEWARFCKANKMPHRKFSRDVVTRWNSTFKLLNESFAYKDLLCAFYNCNSEIEIYPQSWDVCASICSLLEVFDQATNVFSGVYYPTAHLLLQFDVNIVDKFKQFKDDMYLKDCVVTMKNKWLIYFKEIPPLFLVATVFDPRCRTELLEVTLDVYYETLNLPAQENIDVKTTLESTKKIINDLFTEFSNVSASATTTNVVGSSSSGEGGENLNKMSLIYAERQKRARGSGASSWTELDKYFCTEFEFSAEDCDPCKFDILEWWSRHEGTFPILARIAKELLAAPVSTVAVEQAFSAGGLLVSEKRTRLGADSLEAQACLGDWARAEQRTQDKLSSSDDDEDFEGSGTTSGDDN